MNRALRLCGSVATADADPGWDRTIHLRTASVQDFRSGQGFFSQFQDEQGGVPRTGKQLFSYLALQSSVDRPILFKAVAFLKTIVDRASPSVVHRLMKVLDDRRTLLRVYSQNVDGLERRVGLTCSSDGTSGTWDVHHTRTINLHGTVDRVRCEVCSTMYALTLAWHELFASGLQPECPACASNGQLCFAGFAFAPECTLLDHD